MLICYKFFQLQIKDNTLCTENIISISDCPLLHLFIQKRPNEQTAHWTL